MKSGLVPVYGAGATIHASSSSRSLSSPTAVSDDRCRLLERTDELAAIDAAIGAARAGTGAMVLVEGPPGIGKTELLTMAAARGRHRRMLVLSARGGELERSFPHALVRQLFEPVVTRASRATRDGLLSGAAARPRS